MRYLNEDELELLTKLSNYLVDITFLDEDNKQIFIEDTLNWFFSDEFQNKLKIDDNLIYEYLTNFLYYFKE